MALDRLLTPSSVLWRERFRLLRRRDTEWKRDAHLVHLARGAHQDVAMAIFPFYLCHRRYLACQAIGRLLPAPVSLPLLLEVSVPILRVSGAAFLCTPPRDLTCHQNVLRRSVLTTKFWRLD